MTTSKLNLNSIIGTGLKFPVEFASEKQSTLLKLQTGVDKIHQSLHILFSTRKGERYYNVEVGCGLSDYLFELQDLVLRDLLYYEVTSAIQRWERRITVTSVSFQSSEEDPTISPNQINITINYIINQTHQIGSYVYPFVLNGMSYNDMIIGKQSSSVNLR